jgi:hypothetical protein
MLREIEKVYVVCICLLHTFLNQKSRKDSRRRDCSNSEK